ncbi:MAG: hypothetical protein AAFP22_21565, partial [Planctomycetota bacterium]
AGGDIDTHFLEALTIEPPDDYAALAAVAAALYRNGLARRRALAPVEASRGGWLARSRAETASFANYPETLAAAEETPGR